MAAGAGAATGVGAGADLAWMTIECSATGFFPIGRWFQWNHLKPYKGR